MQPPRPPLPRGRTQKRTRDPDVLVNDGMRMERLHLARTLVDGVCDHSRRDGRRELRWIDSNRDDGMSIHVTARDRHR